MVVMVEKFILLSAIKITWTEEEKQLTLSYSRISAEC